MDAKISTVLLLYLNINHVLMSYVADIIKEDTTFYYQKLSEYPSKSATIIASIDCSFKTKIEVNIRLDIYTTEDDINLKKNCSYRRYKQLRNLAAVKEFYSGPRGMCNNQTDKIASKRKIQDYIPRNYAFSFGYRCTSRTYSLKGLSFNISIIEQSNATKCFQMPEQNACFKYYKHLSLPNLFGHRSESEIDKRITDMYLFLNIQLSSSGICHKYIVESACYVLMPKCNPQTHLVTHLCREACYELKEACFNNVTLLPALLKIFQGSGILNSTQVIDYFSSHKFHDDFDCSYLPSKNHTTPCFHKSVTCANPPNVSDATTKIDTNEPHSPSSRVEYSCNDNSFILQGNSTTECLYSGQWSQGPRCTLKPDLQPWKSIVIPTSSAVVVVAIVTLVLVIKMCRKKSNSQRVTRQKLYDAFVCYSYGEKDSEFAENTIRIHLEEQRPFKLCIHRRDFLAAWDIKWNTMNAIRNSNSAIIVMSQDYVNSLWCKEEFEDCYMENMKDSAFKLFVIMMQPMKTLNNNNEYIKSFFDRKTYLESTDPKLFKKIANYLAWVKRVKENEELLVERRELLCDGDQNIRQEKELFPDHNIEKHVQTGSDDVNGSDNDCDEEYNEYNDDNNDDNYEVPDEH